MGGSFREGGRDLRPVRRRVVALHVRYRRATTPRQTAQGWPYGMRRGFFSPVVSLLRAARLASARPGGVVPDVAPRGESPHTPGMMAYDPALHHRHSIRLWGYDYATAGDYAVTVVTQGRARLCGEIAGGEMRLSPAGEMVRAAWEEMPTFYPGVAIEAFQVMPNHVHGIVVLYPVGAGPRPCPLADEMGGNDTGPNTTDRRAATGGRPYGLAEVVGRFKSLTTKRYADGVRAGLWPAFEGRLWQRNYYEHIIRDDEDWARIVEYIRTNPAPWGDDAENR